ncbi:D-alanine transaminase [Erwinia toletana]|uniref:branched-chain-amino-acid transaminase n=1 Tax=Winslowiella toletana TaxID=92490 RepID=A0ABS4PBK0_9GAMM|nr:D-amino-acid transaminase [Winslowiella toletana]MBP2170013.1 D-alanine transaminase [Winslowiella toletana]
MQRIYVNGEFVDQHQARVSVFDRGFLFADAVYEVTAVVNGQLVDFDGHMQRLQRSCKELALRVPLSADQLHQIHLTLIEQNDLHEGSIYLQLSRGSAGVRDFHFPGPDVEPTLVLFTQQHAIVQHAKLQNGLKVVTWQDIRWQRRDIKTVGLLAACMAKEYARAQQADDVLFVEHGLITEGSSSNCHMVLADNTLVTTPLSHAILPGITRATLLRLCAAEGINVVERSFSPQEAYQAQELFISSATTFVLPVVALNGHTIGGGVPGPVVQRLRERYIRELTSQ